MPCESVCPVPLHSTTEFYHCTKTLCCITEFRKSSNFYKNIFVYVAIWGCWSITLKNIRYYWNGQYNIKRDQKIIKFKYYNNTKWVIGINAGSAVFSGTNKPTNRHTDIATYELNHTRGLSSESLQQDWNFLTKNLIVNF